MCCSQSQARFYYICRMRLLLGAVVKTTEYQLKDVAIIYGYDADEYKSLRQIFAAI